MQRYTLEITDTESEAEVLRLLQSLPGVVVRLQTNNDLAVTLPDQADRDVPLPWSAVDPALRVALEEAIQSVQAGKTIPASAVKEKLIQRWRDANR